MKPEAAREALDALKRGGVDFAACLPDSAFKELYEPLSQDPDITYIQVSNEADAVGICMGAWIGGRKPVLIMENAGFTVCSYALLRGPIAFGVPMLLLVNHRGFFHDQRWFSVPIGWATKPLFETLRINYQVASRAEDVEAAISGALAAMNACSGTRGCTLWRRHPFLTLMAPFP